MAVKLSKRMQAIVNLVPDGAVVCDVGCDHGFVPIHLIQSGKCQKALAMDVRPGPLDRAKEHIERCGLNAVIETRLSDGLQNLRSQEADTVIIAGMGGGLVMKILSEARHVIHEIQNFILQPQSEIGEVRAFIRNHGLCIVAEDMVLEDGKYYPMMLVKHKDAKQEQIFHDSERLDSQELEVLDLYGPLLLKDKHPILGDYLKKEQEHYLEILDSLSRLSNTEKRQTRIEELKVKLKCNEMARHLWGC